MAVEVGIGAELFDEVDPDRQGAGLAGADELEGLGAEPQDDAVFGGVEVGVVKRDARGAGEAGTLPIRIDFVEELGSDSYLYGHLDGGGWIPEGQADDSTGSIVVRTPPRSDVREGELIHARVTPRGLHAFSASTGERI